MKHLKVTYDNKAALLSPRESHVNEPGNWRLYLFLRSSCINRVFVNSHNRRRNKQMSLTVDGNKLIIYLGEKKGGKTAHKSAVDC